MQFFNALSLIVAFTGLLVSASPIANPSPSSTPSCPSGKPFTGEAGCSQCSTVGNMVCGRDEDRVTDLICTNDGISLTWVPIDDPKKCGVVSPPKETTEWCPSGKPFDATRKSCEMCMVEGNIVCGLDGQMKSDLKCTKVAGSLIWVAVGGHGCGW